ncbi:class I SAM-dependent methyltransferase [Paenibacillus sacheonensis]|uniref:SAM-dependent methyltransferase n=1 Tax=Paenibacillus sacheonensis TaxID=742054 RepID=A0A7X4YTJ8_9BACL|nr:SAM-dependent methyltransferase [Paenibacillus sacheonensis]MBM7565689.1 SAM-dependent MidA family methyltransferase [Paenibacillus sacheonensis]NBC72253.1 SAM-dependent methyltransferase [Paenibacillus sacheonensis]
MEAFNRLETAILETIARSERRGWPDEAVPAGEAWLPAITFHAYMAMCLYDEFDGYYKSGPVRIGKSGDFYTSSAIGSMMGSKLAGYVTKLAEAQDRPAVIMEWGAGTGALAVQMLSAWEQAAPPWLASAQYSLVDGNAVHLEEAKSRFVERGLGSAGEGISVSFMTPQEAEASLESGPEERFVVVLANELLDAMPVHRVVRKAGRLWELGVAAAAGEQEGQAFRYVYMPLSDERIAGVLNRDGIQLREGQITEVNLDAEQWIKSLGGRIRHGCLLLIDYGHDARELTASHRMHGTLLCYKDHIARDEPFQNPGDQDLTAHVNFTGCTAAGEDAGWKPRYYGTQKQFLLDEGLLSDLVRHDGADPFSEAARHNRSIRQLLLSDAMSETFKVLVLEKSEQRWTSK